MAKKATSNEVVFLFNEYNKEGEVNMEIVNTNINYTYEIMINDINKLKKRYEFIENGSIGYSVLGKNMPSYKDREWE